MRVNRAGTFMMYAIDSKVGKSKANKYPQFVAQFQGVQEFNFESSEWVDVAAEELETRGSFVLAGKDGKVLFNVENISKAFGWTSGSVQELNDADYSDVPVVVVIKENEFEGRTTYRPDGIYPQDADPTTIGGIQELDAGELAKIDALYSAKFKAHLGGEKPKSVPTKKSAVSKTGKSRPSTTAAKTAAQEKVVAKKARAAQAEKKAIPPNQKFEKPAIPKIPAPAAVEPELEKVEVVTLVSDTCTKNEAYELLFEHAVDEAACNEVWAEVVENNGYDVEVDATEHGWATVARECLKQV